MTDNKPPDDPAVCGKNCDLMTIRRFVDRGQFVNGFIGLNDEKPKSLDYNRTSVILRVSDVARAGLPAL